MVNFTNMLTLGLTNAKGRNNFSKQKPKKQKQVKTNMGNQKCATMPAETRTIESLREIDQTIVENFDPSDVDELDLQFNSDEFHSYFDGRCEPKILITFFGNPSKRTRMFGLELTKIFANAIVMLRKISTKEITKIAIRQGFTDIVIINENRRQPNALLLMHLPDGPTAYFKLSNVRLTKDIKRNHKEISSHRTELILTNFTTRLGMTIGRLLGCLFHHEPEFEGRKVATFHNQRDYIFFRHHRYEFIGGKRANLRELGPRFTLKLRSLQEGTFNSKFGDYAWIITNKRHSLESRRRFFL